MADGNIHHQAAQFLTSRTREKRILKPFLMAGFDVTWASVRSYAGTTLTVAFLKPSIELAEAYGFDYEIVLAYSHFTTIEPRTLLAIDAVLADAPAKGRVEPLLYFIVSEATDAVEWVTSYLNDHKEARIAVPFRAHELAAGDSDEWTIRNHLHRHFLLLDRFKYTLPLREDTYFFGRVSEVGSLLERVRRSENAGVFGLRKTGKTSVLLKLKRVLEHDPEHLVEVIDAQSPDVRRRRWNQLLSYIANQLLSRVGCAPLGREFSDIDAAAGFRAALLVALSKGPAKRVTFVFDEVEWITPGTARDLHWTGDFLEFWQVLRTVQAPLRALSFVVAGVNPAIAEESRFGDFQNPLFGIVTPIFLRGLTDAETKEMVLKIGKVVGLSFGDDAIDYLIDQYGCHPLLTRLACSTAADMAKASGVQFPAKVSRGRLEEQKRLRDGELVFYVRHVVDELERFYPSEYALLETLASGGYQEFQTAVSASQAGAHLFRYGVVSDPMHPFITYDVLQDYVAGEAARREGRPCKYRLVPSDARRAFLTLRLKAIAEDMRELERVIRDAGKPLLFGPNSFPEAEKLFGIEAPGDENSFGVALSVLNRCFVESVERFGESCGHARYFWTTIATAYPDLHEALHRIKTYRHEAHHLELKPGVRAALRTFLDRDLEESLSTSPERHWALFQRCLDELFRAVQKEIARIDLPEGAASAKKRR